MREVDLNLAIDYIIHRKTDITFQVAWFNNIDDAKEFLEVMPLGVRYEISKVRR